MLCVCEGQQVVDQWYSEVERYDFSANSGPKTGRQQFYSTRDISRNICIHNIFTDAIILRIVIFRLDVCLQFYVRCFIVFISTVFLLLSRNLNTY